MTHAVIAIDPELASADWAADWAAEAAEEERIIQNAKLTKMVEAAFAALETDRRIE